MARKDCLPPTRAREHAPGDPVRIFGGDAWRGGWDSALLTCPWQDFWKPWAEWGSFPRFWRGGRQTLFSFSWACTSSSKCPRRRKEAADEQGLWRCCTPATTSSITLD